jgi:YqaJ-like viral recombinase domain
MPVVKRSTAAAPAQLRSELVILDVVQGTEDWFRARMGMPSASNFHTVMAAGRDGDASMTRAEYMRRLAGEIITDEPAEETFKSRAMERGKEMEPQAIADYERRKGVEVQRVGLGINFSGLKKCCASPDGLVGFGGGLETKTMRPDKMIVLLEKNVTMPPEHRAQVMGNMLVFERDVWDFKIFYPKMPDFTVSVFRDDAYIRELHNQIEIFNHELGRMVQKLRSMGAGNE